MYSGGQIINRKLALEDMKLEQWELNINRYFFLAKGA
jgi:hypothetical protein